MLTAVNFSSSASCAGQKFIGGNQIPYTNDMLNICHQSPVMILVVIRFCRRVVGG